MLESMFDQETVTRNEILRHRREAAKKAAQEAKKKVEEEAATKMLVDGVSDENILAWSGISKPDLEDLKKKLEKGKQDQPAK